MLSDKASNSLNRKAHLNILHPPGIYSDMQTHNLVDIMDPVVPGYIEFSQNIWLYYCLIKKFV